jgi:hypothetical protein
LDELRKLTLPSGQALEFILAVPGRRYNEFVELLSPLQTQCAQANIEITGEVAWNDLRLVLAHDPATALEQQQKRQAKMNELQTQALGQWRQGAFLSRGARGPFGFGQHHQGEPQGRPSSTVHATSGRSVSMKSTA